MSNTPSFLREDAARSERWKHLTEGLDGYQRKVVETLLDNLQKEGLHAGERIVEDPTTTQNVSVFTRLARPLIRRIYPALVANRLVSIQPMTMPTAMVFYLDFKYGTNFAPTVKGDRTDFEAGRRNKWYASGVIRGEAVGTGDGATTTFNLDWYPVKVGSLVVYVDSTPTAVTLDAETGQITFGAAPANGASITADYALEMEALGTKGNAVIPEVTLDMASSQVGTETKKIKARLTLEAMQDFRAYHDIDADEELAQHMGDEIRYEIDRIIIDDLFLNATAGNVNWSKTVPAGSTEKEHYQTLIHAIGDASSQIYKKRFRHANFVVMSPDTAALLDRINAVRLLNWGNQDGALTNVTIASGPDVMGTMANRYHVIVDPLFPNDKILVGFKGNSWFDTGYVYAPYTAYQTQTFVDPNTLVPVKALMTRFGRHLVNGDFYATVTITT